MGFWSALLIINVIVGSITMVLTGLGRIVWETIRIKAPNWFYFPLNKNYFNGIPHHPTRAFILIYVNAAVILNLIVITIYLGKRLS